MNRKPNDFDPSGMARASESPSSAMAKVPEPNDAGGAQSIAAPVAAAKLGNLKTEEPDPDHKDTPSREISVQGGANPSPPAHSVKTNYSSDNDNKAGEKPTSDQQEAGGEGNEDEKTAFPILLHEIVSDPETDDCIHWLPCGTRFIIPDKQKFANEVLPKYYGHAKFTSFTRRLKRWSFSRVPSGPFMGAYYNADFRRGEPERAAKVRYSHPAPLSVAAIQLNKAKLEAVGAGMGGIQGLEAFTAALTPQGRANLLSMNAAGLLPGGIQGLLGGENNALLRALNDHSGGMNNNMAVQLAVAQEMQRRQMQQQQQQTSLPPELLAQLQGSSGGNNTLEQKLIQANPALAAQLIFGNQMNNTNAVAAIDQNTRLAMLLAQQQQQQQNTHVAAAGANADAKPDNQNLLTAMLIAQMNENQQRHQQQQQRHQQQQMMGMSSHPNLGNMLQGQSGGNAGVQQHRSNYSSPNLSNVSTHQGQAAAQGQGDQSLSALLAEWLRRNPQGDNKNNNDDGHQRDL